MPEIPDHISLSDLTDLQKDAPLGIKSLSAQEFILACKKYESDINELILDMKSISAPFTDQERLYSFLKAKKQLIHAQALLKKATSV